MHILMTADTIGGVWTYALELARAMERSDVSVSLATMGRRLTRAQRRDVSQLNNVEVFESEYRLEWMEDSWEDIAHASTWLWELARDCQPDVVHLNQFAFGNMRWPAPCLVVGHSCVLSWHHEVRKAPAGPEWNLYRNIVKQGIRGADVVVAPTQSMLNMLQRFYGPIRNARTILNGYSRTTAGMREPKEPIIFCAGRLWDQAKNVGALAAIVPRLPWPVFVAGLPHPDAKADPHPQADGVKWLGELSANQMEHWYSRASIYALPARYEPFGLTPLEAASAGCALMLGDIATLREIWGNAAVFVPPEDQNALATAIEKLATDDSRRNKFACRAAARAAELGAERMATEYVQLYRRLMADQPRRSYSLNGITTTAGAV